MKRGRVGIPAQFIPIPSAFHLAGNIWRRRHSGSLLLLLCAPPGACRNSFDFWAFGTAHTRRLGCVLRYALCVMRIGRGMTNTQYAEALDPLIAEIVVVIACFHHQAMYVVTPRMRGQVVEWCGENKFGKTARRLGG